MRKLLSLILHEINVQNRVLHIIRYHSQFSVLSVICLALISEDTQAFAKLFLILILPFSVIIPAKDMIRCEFSCGSLEMLMTSCRVSEIIFVKFIGLVTNNILALTISTIMACILCSFDPKVALLDFFIKAIFLLQLCSMSILISSIEAYFRSNTDLILSIILPFVVPGIIICGLAIHNSLLFIFYTTYLLGVTLLLVPIILILSGYVLSNIYNL